MRTNDFVIYMVVPAALWKIAFSPNPDLFARPKVSVIQTASWLHNDVLLGAAANLLRFSDSLFALVLQMKEFVCTA